MKKKILIGLGIVIVALGIFLAATYEKPVKSDVESTEISYSLDDVNQGVIDSVEETVSDSEMEEVKNRVGDLTIDETTTAEDIGDIKYKDTKDKVRVFTSEIDWSDGEVTQNQFEDLLRVAGLMYQDLLNKEDPGKYTVEINPLDVEEIDKFDVPVYYYVTSDDGVMHLQVKLEIYNTKDNKHETKYTSLGLKYNTNILEFSTDVTK